LRINVIDVDGFISQCELSFSNGESVQSVEVVSVSTNKPVRFCQMLEINKVFKCCYGIFFISSTDPKGHMIYCHHFVSDVRLSIAIMHISHFDHLIWLLDQPEANFTVMRFTTSYASFRPFILIREKTWPSCAISFISLMIH
jgi:hypothetical protein